MNNTKLNKSIFSSDFEDFYKIFFPSLLCILVLLLEKISFYSVYLLMGLSVCDIGHIYSSGIETYLDPEIRSMKSTMLATATGLIIASVMVIFFSSYVTYIFFYSIVFHNMRQGLGITLIYRHKAARTGLSTNLFKKIYYILILFPFALFHFRNPLENLGWLQKFYFTLPVEKWFSAFHFPSIVFYGTAVYLVLLLGFFIFFITTEDWRSVFSLFFFVAIYSFSYLFSYNLLYSTFLLITSHAIPYLFLVQGRSKLFHTNKIVRKFPTIVVAAVIFLGFIYYTFFYSKIGEVASLSKWQKFFIIVPSYIHYAIDGHVWKKGYVRFAKFLQS